MRDLYRGTIPLSTRRSQESCLRVRVEVSLPRHHDLVGHFIVGVTVSDFSLLYPCPVFQDVLCQSLPVNTSYSVNEE